LSERTTRFMAACAAAAAFLQPCLVVHAASSVPPFEVAYRAWEVVTQLTRRHGAPAISGECGKTFRPFVVPGLRRQTKQEQDVAASACVQAARAACANATLRATAEIAGKCEEFR
jgi:hypothetical protein